MPATANTGKNSGEVWEKNAGECTGRVEITKEEIPSSKPLEDREGTVSIGGRTITNLRFADDIDEP